MSQVQYFLVKIHSAPDWLNLWKMDMKNMAKVHLTYFEDCFVIHKDPWFKKKNFYDNGLDPKCKGSIKGLKIY